MAGATRRGWTAVTPRTRGALSGFGLILLGIWGALIPFVGPYWSYAYSPNTTWTWTAARFWLQVLPGAATFLAGLVILLTASRAVAWLFALLGVAAGSWFVVGPLLAPLWRVNYLGSPVGGRTDASVEAIGIFYGLGAAIIILAAFAMGRFSLAAARDLSYEGVAPGEPTAVAPAVTGVAPAGNAVAPAATPTANATGQRTAESAYPAAPPPAVVDPMAASGAAPDQRALAYGTQSTPVEQPEGRRSPGRGLFGMRGRAASHRRDHDSVVP